MILDYLVTFEGGVPLGIHFSSCLDMGHVKCILLVLFPLLLFWPAKFYFYFQLS